MRQKRRGRPRTAADICQEVDGIALADRLAKAAEVERRLASDPRFADRVPSERWIRDRLKAARGADTSPPWSLVGADPAEAAAALPVFFAVVGRSRGQITSLSTKQAFWLGLVARAASDLDPWFVWKVAAAYLMATAVGREADVESLDGLLLFAPWRSREAMSGFMRWTLAHRPEWWGLERRVVSAGQAAQAHPAVGRIRRGHLQALQEMDGIGVKTLKGPPPPEAVHPVGVVVGVPAGGWKAYTAGVAIALEIEKALQEGGAQ